MFFEDMFASEAFGASRIRVPLLMLGWLGKMLYPTLAAYVSWGSATPVSLSQPSCSIVML